MFGVDLAGTFVLYYLWELMNITRCTLSPKKKKNPNVYEVLAKLSSCITRKKNVYHNVPGTYAARSNAAAAAGSHGDIHIYI